MQDKLFSLFPKEPSHLLAWDPASWSVDASWQGVVTDFFDAPTGLALGRALQARLQQNAVIFPPQPLRALALTPLPKVRVVIVGQDPYHGPHQANGLAFSVGSGVKVPPSLRNIYQEIQRDPLVSGAPWQSRHGTLEEWAAQGVLLLNSCLTVEAGQPGSHNQLGWEVLTDEIIQLIWRSAQPVVFMLWGAHAQNKRALLQPGATAHPLAAEGADHLVLCANHPSPLSARRPPQPFIGCGHFSMANAHLVNHGRGRIAW